MTFTIHDKEHLPELSSFTRISLLKATDLGQDLEAQEARE